MNKDTRNGQCLHRQADRSDNTRRRIQSARCGGGRGVYGHIDGVFHSFHGDGRQSEDTVLTRSHYPRQEKGRVGEDLVALTWNAGGMEQCAEQDIIDLLEAAEGESLAALAALTACAAWNLAALALSLACLAGPRPCHLAPPQMPWCWLIRLTVF